MAKEIDIVRELTELGYSPISNSCILVKFGAEDFISKASNLLKNGIINDKLLVLQICNSELILLPLALNKLFDRDNIVEIPFSEIKNIDITSDLVNYNIDILTYDEEIILQTPKANNLMEKFLNNTLVFAQEDFWNQKNWHRDNLENTLDGLKNIL